MKTEYPTEYRIVKVDEHIIAQFNMFTGPNRSESWYTCSKADNNDENDFAVWAHTEANLGKARNLIGKCEIVECPSDCQVSQHTDNGWYIHRGDVVDDKAYGSYSEALRNLARSL